MKKMMFPFAITCSILFSQVSLANIPDREKTVNWDQVVILPGTASAFKEYFDKYMPPNLTPTTSTMALGQEIQTKTTQRVTDNFLNGDFFKKSVAGKAIQSVQKAADSSVSFGNPEKHEIVHTFKVKFKVIERNAELDYSGFFNSHVIYNMDTSVTNLSVSKPLDDETSLSFVNSTNIYQVQFNPTLTLTHNF